MRQHSGQLPPHSSGSDGTLLGLEALVIVIVTFLCW